MIFYQEYRLNDLEKFRIEFGYTKYQLWKLLNELVEKGHLVSPIIRRGEVYILRFGYGNDFKNNSGTNTCRI